MRHNDKGHSASCFSRWKMRGYILVAFTPATESGQSHCRFIVINNDCPICSAIGCAGASPKERGRAFAGWADEARLRARSLHRLSLAVVIVMSGP
jgi:hypothetical protein